MPYGYFFTLLICVECGRVYLPYRSGFNYTKLTPARILVSYVVAGVILTAIGVYEPIVKFAGAGATVPLTGFGYSLACGVKEAVKEYGFMGILMGGLTATSAGIATAVVSGFLMAALFKPGDKT